MLRKLFSNWFNGRDPYLYGYNHYSQTAFEKHYIREALRTLLARIIGLISQIDPILIILNLCGVISIPLWILITVWVGYHIILFISDIIDVAYKKHDQRELIMERKKKEAGCVAFYDEQEGE